MPGPAPSPLNCRAPGMGPISPRRCAATRWLAALALIVMRRRPRWRTAYVNPRQDDVSAACYRARHWASPSPRRSPITPTLLACGSPLRDPRRDARRATAAALRTTAVLASCSRCRRRSSALLFVPDPGGPLAFCSTTPYPAMGLRSAPAVSSPSSAASLAAVAAVRRHRRRRARQRASAAPSPTSGATSWRIFWVGT